MVNVPKSRKTFCPGRKCRRHTLHKVTQYKAGKASLFAQGMSATQQIQLAIATKDIFDDLQLRVVDVLGKEIYRKDFKMYNNLLEQQIDIEHWNSGLYFIQVTARDRTQTISFSKY